MENAHISSYVFPLNWVAGRILQQVYKAEQKKSIAISEP